MDALDEAAFMVLEGLHLPIDRLDPFLDARLLPFERERLADLIDARVSTRKPAPYLLNKAYIKGVPFYVDERVIVPRSFIGELLFTDLFAGGEGGVVEDPNAVESVLDLCTGSGALAILAARVFPFAQIDAVELSPDAAAVARRNIDESGFAERIELLQGDLFAPLKGRRYDIIITNPPYVGHGDASARICPRARDGAGRWRGRSRHREADFKRGRSTSDRRRGDDLRNWPLPSGARRSFA